MASTLTLGYFKPSLIKAKPQKWATHWKEFPPVTTKREGTSSEVMQ